jgi:hypothetical protein
VAVAVGDATVAVGALAAVALCVDAPFAGATTALATRVDDAGAAKLDVVVEAELADADAAVAVAVAVALAVGDVDDVDVDVTASDDVELGAAGEPAPVSLPAAVVDDVEDGVDDGVDDDGDADDAGFVDAAATSVGLAGDGGSVESEPEVDADVAGAR